MDVGSHYPSPNRHSLSLRLRSHIAAHSAEHAVALLAATVRPDYYGVRLDALHKNNQLPTPLELLGYHRARYPKQQLKVRAA